jgi:hypothetical protein
MRSFSTFFLFFSTCILFAQVGIGTEDPQASLHIKEDKITSEIIVENENSANITLDAGSPAVNWKQNGEARARVSWSSGQLKFVSSPGVPPFGFTYPTLNLSENKQVGINMGLIGSPSQTLDVNGKIKVADDEYAPEEGTIRWNDEKGDFEGYDGSKWLSLTSNNNKGVSGSGFGEITDIHQLNYLADDFDIDGEFAAFAFGAPIREIYIYRRSGSSWVLFQQISEQVSEITILGNDMAAYVVGVGVQTYKFDGSLWIENVAIQRPTVSGITVNNFGSAIEIFGDRLAIGAYASSNGGLVFVYQKTSSGIWLNYTIINHPDTQPGDYFGFSLAIDEDDLIIGAPRRNQGAFTAVGRAYHYELTNGNFVFKSIYSSQGFAYADEQRFGLSVAVSFDQIAISFSDTNNPTSSNGVVLFYDKNLLTIPTNQITIKNNSLTEKLYPSIDIKGNFLIVGNRLLGVAKNGNCSLIEQHQGSILVYYFENNIWNKISEFVDPGGEESDFFGSEVAISQDGWFISQYQRNPSEYRKKAIIAKAEY